MKGTNMKHTLFLSLIIVLLACIAPIFAEVDGLQVPDLERMELSIEARRMELKMENMEFEANYEREMRQLELEERRAEIKRIERGPSHHKGKHGGMFCIIFIIVHILTTIWVYQDIKRTKISGIWIAIALLAGLLGTLVYAVIRIPELPEEE
jgi:hypothetical protein